MTIPVTKETIRVALKLGRDRKLMALLVAQPTVHELETTVRSCIEQGALPRLNPDKIQYGLLFENLKNWRD